MNCDKKSFLEELSHSEVQKDDLRISASNAIANFLMPWNYEFDWKGILGIIWHLGGNGALHKMEALGITTKDGYVRLTMDPFLLDQLKDQNDIQKSKLLFNEKKNMIKYKHTMFVEYQDTTRDGEEVCISDKKYPEY